MPEIRHQIIVEAPPPRVQRALAEEEGLAAWWTEDVRGESRVGKVLEFGFGHHTVVIRVEVQEIAPDTVRWYCLGGILEWKSTTIYFRLEPSGPDATLVDFGHTGWQSADGALPRCSYDWAHYLTSLKQYVETGSGVPHPIYRSLGRMR